MEKFDKISSKYILKEIFSYIQLNKSLKKKKKSQKLQKVLDISLFTYQNSYAACRHKYYLDNHILNCDACFILLFDCSF